MATTLTKHNREFVGEPSARLVDSDFGPAGGPDSGVPSNRSCLVAQRLPNAEITEPSASESVGRPP